MIELGNLSVNNSTSRIEALKKIRRLAEEFVSSAVQG